MKYFMDTEFAEKPCTIDLISIGIVADDGRELYLECSEFGQVNDWVAQNVLPYLGEVRYTKAEIRDKILAFVGDDKPQFWGWYCDYDWVVFCWLFGDMTHLPKGWPMFCCDLKQEAVLHHGDTPIPFRAEQAHNSLSDARWVRDAYNWMKSS